MALVETFLKQILNRFQIDFNQVLTQYVCEYSFEIEFYADLQTRWQTSLGDEALAERHRLSGGDVLDCGVISKLFSQTY